MIMNIHIIRPNALNCLTQNNALWVKPEEPQTLWLYHRSELVYAALVHVRF